MQTRRTLAACIVGCLMLAACSGGGADVAADGGTSPTEQPRVGTRQASAPAPLHDRLAGENQRLQVRLDTAQGHTVTLNHWFALRGDCQLQDYVRVAAVFPPAHGRLQILTGRFHPDYPVDNRRHDCNGEPRDGIAALYHPQPGFTGTDTTTLRITAPSGKSWTTDFVITVH